MGYTTEEFVQLVRILLIGRSNLQVSKPEPSGNVQGGFIIEVVERNGLSFNIEIVGPDPQDIHV